MKKILLTLMISPFLAFGQGTVDFEDVTLPTSYDDGSFEVGGTTYTYGRSRDHDGYPIEGAGLLLQRPSDSYFEWTSNNGVGQVTFEYRKAYTGANTRQLELLVNGVRVAVSPVFGEGSGEQADIYTFTHEVNEDGAVTIKIKNVGNTTGGRQFVIDNVVWTAFDATQVCEAPTGLAVTNVSESSADVSWTAGGTEAEWIVVYGPTGFDFADYINNGNGAVSEVTVTGTPETTLSGLEEGTDYDVYVIAICGTDLESNAVNTTFTTETTSVPTCDAPTGLSVDNITETSADVSWTEGGTENEWIVVYGPTGFVFADYTNNGAVSEVPVTGTPETTLSGLEEGTDYDVYVIALCGTDLESNAVNTTFTTETTSVPTCDAPTNLTVSNISATSADVSWTVGGTETEWIVVYGPTGFVFADYTNNGAVSEFTVTDTPETTLSGLDAETEYDVYVIAKCDDDLFSDELGPVSFTTKTSSIDKQLFESFSFYPNPIQNVINLKSGSNIEYVQVYDMLGKNVIEVAPNALSVELNTSKLQKGVYIMKVTIKGTQETFRIVKK